MYTVIIQYVMESVTGGKACGRQKDWPGAEVQTGYFQSQHMVHNHKSWSWLSKQSTTIHTLATRDVHHHWHWCDKHLDALPTIWHIKRYIWSNYWCNKKDTIYQYCNVVRFNTIWFNTKRFNVIWYDLMRCKRMMLCNSIWYGLILSLKHKA